MKLLILTTFLMSTLVSLAGAEQIQVLGCKYYTYDARSDRALYACHVSDGSGKVHIAKLFTSVDSCQKYCR